MEPNDLPGAEQAASAATRRIHKAGGTLHQTIDRLADPTIETVEQVSYAAHARVDKLESRVTSIAETLSEKMDRVLQAPRQARETARQRIQDKPFESVAAAATVGLIVGAILAMRRGRSDY